MRPISSAMKKVIHEHYLKDFDIREWYYPSSICTSCRVNCNSPSVMLHLYKYKYNYTQLTRSSDTCSCEVCKAAKIVLGTNLPGVVPNKVKPGRPRKKNFAAATAVKMCNIFLTEIKRGKKHGCTLSEGGNNRSTCF